MFDELHEAIDRMRLVYDALADEERYAKRRGEFVQQTQLHRARLWVSARLATLEKEERRRRPAQLELLSGRAGRRHDDGDAA